ncbi:sugar kinase [Halorubraceae archaeon YAN]|nr:sugar kinase [Halorubraceae archaeon YAN]
MTTEASTDAATAFVPGHITGFFSTHPADTPVESGSRGAGITLTHGVDVCVAEGTGTTLNGEHVSVEPVDRVLDMLAIDVAVTAETPLPLGAGFGVSGALSLGTALAANAAFDCGRSENELISIAHNAEVESGTGLGDVVSQARGGVPIRLSPGAPGYGLLDGIPAPSQIEYCTFGELSTESVLSGDTTRLTNAGETALETLIERPTLDRLMTCSQQFAREAGLLTSEVAAAIEAVDAVGGSAAMAMLGQTVFALGTGLSDAGYEPSVCQTHATGASLRLRE